MLINGALGEIFIQSSHVVFMYDSNLNSAESGLSLIHTSHVFITYRMYQPWNTGPVGHNNIRPIYKIENVAVAEGQDISKALACSGIQSCSKVPVQ